MLTHAEYEKRVLNEIRQIPTEAMIRMMRLFLLVKEGPVMNDKSYMSGDENITHERTRQLLSTSKSNWAQSIISEREDRL